MSTVPGPNDPAPANNAKTLIIGDGSGMYARPTAGGNAAGGTPLGGSSNAPAGVVPANPIVGGSELFPPSGGLAQAYDSAAYMEANAGAAPSTGGTQVGADIGHGAAIVINDSGDRESGAPDASTNGGTVGDSGPQGGA